MNKNIFFIGIYFIHPIKIHTVADILWQKIKPFCTNLRLRHLNFFKLQVKCIIKIPFISRSIMSIDKIRVLHRKWGANSAM